MLKVEGTPRRPEILNVEWQSFHLKGIAYSRGEMMKDERCVDSYMVESQGRIKDIKEKPVQDLEDLPRHIKDFGPP